MKHKSPFAIIAFLILAGVMLVSCGGNVVADPVVEATPPTTSVASIEPTEPPDPTQPPEPVEPTKSVITDYEEIAFSEPLNISADCKNNRIKEISAVDEFTLRVTLCRPDAAFVEKIALPPFSIAPREWIEAYANVEHQEKLLYQPVGTGPYYLKNWDRGDSIVFKRFDGYWGDPARTETLIFRWDAEDKQRLLALQSGTVDYITELSTDDYETVQNDANLTFLPVANPNIMYLAMVNTSKPFDDVNIRKAIAMGIDRQRIAENFYPAGTEVASHFAPCSIPNACLGEAWYEFDVDAANTLLDQTGLTRENDGIRFKTTIYYRDVFREYLPYPGPVAIEIQTQLRDNLGIEANVVVMDSDEFIYEVSNGFLDGLYLLGWYGHYLHTTDFLDFHFGSSNPQFGIPYPEIHEDLDSASQITDATKTVELFSKINNTLKSLAPMIPIVHTTSADAALADIGNAQPALLGPPDLWTFVPGERDALIYLSAIEPVSLYCADETDNASLDACKMVAEGLYKNDATGQVIPALATGCVANADAMVYICTLREGVKFHDGSTLDANDVVRSWDAGINIASEYHFGNTGAFEYPAYLFDALMNFGE